MNPGGLSSARLGRMHDIMAGYVERGDMPGLVTVVSRHGDVYIDAIGAKSFGGEPMQRDTIFRIASMTKPIIAVAAMILIEECVLRLDEPVDRFLPELTDRTVVPTLDAPIHDAVPANRSITVRDLLTFRQGFGIIMAPSDTYPIQSAWAEQFGPPGPPQPQTVPAPDEWMRRLGTLPLVHQPGERWMYDTGSDVLGILIARASGQPLETFLRERIFEPLGMRGTGFSVSPENIGRLATSYWTNWETGALDIYDEAEGGQWSSLLAFPSGRGGLVSTADDYLSFGRMLLNNGVHNNERVLSRPSVELMITDHLTPKQKAASGLTGGYFDSHGWGFGLSIVTRRDHQAGTIGSYGWNGGLGTTWDNDPREDMLTILLTQRAWTAPVPPDACLDFWTVAYAAIDD